MHKQNITLQHCSDNNVNNQWTTSSSTTALTIDELSTYFHCSLQYACATVFIKQCTLIIIVYTIWSIELSSYTCIYLHSFLMNLYNKAKHTTISHGCYAGVQFIPATSLVRPTIFGPWVILALITALAIDKLNISTAPSIMCNRVNKTTYCVYIDHIVYTIQLNWVLIHVIAFFFSWTWSCIIQPNTLQFYMAAMQGSSLFQPPL